MVALTLPTVAVTGLVRGTPGLLTLAVCAAVTALLVPPLIAWTRRHHLLSTPGGRSIHAEPTPLLGGIAVFVPVLVVLAVSGGVHPGLAGAGLLLLVAGVVDDLHDLTARAKLGFQAGAAVLLHACGLRLEALEVPLLGIVPLGNLGLPLLVCWVVVVTNAMNTIDGLDGLAAGVGLVAALGALALGLGGPLPLALAGALLGFLLFNLPRASIFLGDSGSLVLGGLLAGLCIESRQGIGVLTLPVAVALLAIPFGDMAVSVVRRALRGRPLSCGDRGHVHHLLLLRWRRSGPVLATLLGGAALCAAAGVAFPDVRAVLVVAVLWAALLGYLVAVSWPRVRTILAHRRSFRRLHVIRRYSRGALAFADAAGEVAVVLDRVAQDLGRAPARALADRNDEVYDEERRATAAEVVRQARRRLAALAVPASHPAVQRALERRLRAVEQAGGVAADEPRPPSRPTPETRPGIHILPAPPPRPAGAFDTRPVLEVWARAPESEGAHS